MCMKEYYEDKAYSIYPLNAKKRVHVFINSEIYTLLFFCSEVGSNKYCIMHQAKTDK